MWSAAGTNMDASSFSRARHRSFPVATITLALESRHRASFLLTADRWLPPEILSWESEEAHW